MGESFMNKATPYRIRRRGQNVWRLPIVGIGALLAMVLLPAVASFSDRRPAQFFFGTAWAATTDSGQRPAERWQDTVTKAKKEGKVVLLGPPVAEVRPSIIQAFQKEFPEIALDYQAGS